MKVRPSLDWLLALVPVAIGMRLFGAPEIAIFLTSAAAIVPLAGLIGRATEQLALHTGPRIGGLVNATFGNVTELIIAIFLILDDRIEIVKASLTGSILGNLLLVLGLSLFVGGVKHERQSFNARSASVHATSLALAVTGLLMPALFALGATDATFAEREIVSGVVAGVLILLYVAALVFTLVTHEHLFRTPEEGETAAWTRKRAVVVLLLTTGAVALMSEFLVSSLEPALESLGLSELFVGLILIPVIGNAAEHSSAVMFALRNKVDVTLEIAIGSSTQIALFVAPVLVFISLAVGHPDGLRLQHVRGGRRRTVRTAHDADLARRREQLAGGSAVDGGVLHHGHLVLLRGAPVRRLGVVLAALAVTALWGSPALAQTSEVIHSYDVAIEIRADDSIRVTEVIAYDFGSTPHHGIFRDVPTREAYDDRYDRVFPLHVESVEATGGASADYEVSQEPGGITRIKIGDPDETITGAHTYTIVYTVEAAMNGFRDHDELYWNAIGEYWEVPGRDRDGDRERTGRPSPTSPATQGLSARPRRATRSGSSRTGRPGSGRRTCSRSRRSRWSWRCPRASSRNRSRGWWSRGASAVRSREPPPRWVCPAACSCS